MTGNPLPPELIAVDILGRSCANSQRKTRPVEERFWGKVDVGSADECWAWRGPTSKTRSKSGLRYGSFCLSGKTAQAHRVAYALCHGLIDASLCIRHSCDNGLCVNPNHLALGTIAQNNEDRSRRKRHGTACLDERQVFQIRRLHLFGLCDPDISRCLCVSRHAVYKARTRCFKYYPWPHVTSRYPLSPPHSVVEDAA